MKTKTYYRTVAYIFSLIAILHGMRLFFGWEAFIGGVLIPLWVSAAAVAIALYLAVRGFSLAKK
jgi:hypothetical protein